jgi:hypothetical protein
VLQVGGHKVWKDKRAFSLNKGADELFVRNNVAPRELKRPQSSDHENPGCCGSTSEPSYIVARE